MQKLFTGNIYKDIASPSTKEKPTRFAAEKAYIIIKTKLELSENINPEDILTLCQYFGIKATISTSVSSKTFSRLKSEGSVHKLLGINEAGNCRRLIKIIHDLKENNDMDYPRDIHMDGDITDITKWSVGQVQHWACIHGLQSITGILSEHAMAGDVINDLNIDMFFMLSDFAVDLRPVFEDEVATLRNFSIL